MQQKCWCVSADRIKTVSAPQGGSNRTQFTTLHPFITLLTLGCYIHKQAGQTAGNDTITGFKSPHRRLEAGCGSDIIRLGDLPRFERAFLKHRNAARSNCSTATCRHDTASCEHGSHPPQIHRHRELRLRAGPDMHRGGD